MKRLGHHKHPYVGWRGTCQCGEHYEIEEEDSVGKEVHEQGQTYTIVACPDCNQFFRIYPVGL